MGKKAFTEGKYRTDRRFRALCAAFLASQSEKEIADLLRDVGTLSELFAWSERFDVARRLAEGQSYREAADGASASTTTVSRVAGFLFDGEGGYQRVLRSQHHHPLSARGERVAAARS